ncbi:tRNA-int-end-N2 domain-containing protein [Mycena indigotica]|uniref:tRNA-int-end-N2 domain-containing protein n=1 Tax=Mycena indigotica TaxID=2126181 RepID=A0A8H6WF48_9AGAR|nr:tRNA-int-end-N2 domain-containing protein [Mycena indigotica]KAF7315467.1 tRNA-int-end-N2 domain-containing protein [Mycena indigotica]
MDDSLEQPDAKPPVVNVNTDAHEEGGDDSDDDGDVVLDWTKLVTARPVIPRRGEKEFEPQPGGGSGLQVHVLDRARNAMFDAIRATRTISSKVVSYTMWHPQISRAHVVLARGTHYNTLGHSVPRPIQTDDGIQKTQKRLELLPEEALYLIERGSAFCWKETDLDVTEVDGAEPVLGAPMSVHQAYTEMIGSQDLTLERYQVYAYLKRLGYVVTRTTPPNPEYPIPPPFDLSPLNKKIMPIWDRIRAFCPSWITRLFVGQFDWWRPLRLSKWSFSGRNYSTMFDGLRFLRSGHSIPLLVPKTAPAIGLPTRSSPYHIFFNVHKPATSYRKTSPCPPDYQIVVVNARTTPMPSLRELTELFDVSPELPPPLPRQRRPGKATFQPGPVAPPPSWTKRLQDWLRNKPPKYVPPPRKPHPFMVMKSGKKTVIVAVVDAGNIGFFRFGQGAFEEMPLV